VAHPVHTAAYLSIICCWLGTVSCKVPGPHLIWTLLLSLRLPEGLSLVHMDNGMSPSCFPFCLSKWVSAASPLPCFPGSMLTPPTLNRTPVLYVFLGNTWLLGMGKEKKSETKTISCAYRSMESWGWPHESLNCLPFDWEWLQALGLKDGTLNIF
jgi:hypothetical protein